MIDSPRPSCNCGVSTSIADEITAGHGRLDDYGYWEFPCTHGLPKWIEAQLAKAQRKQEK